MDLAQLLMLIGISIIGILGGVHLVFTMFSRKFHPYPVSLLESMRTSSPRITKQTSMWKAWVGFNISHSFGAICFAAVYLPLIVTNFAIVSGSVWLSLLPVLVSLVYTILAKIYWFKVPFTGFLLAMIFSFVAAVLINH